MCAYIHNKRIYTFNTCIRTFYVRLCTFKQISVQTHAGLLIAGALHFTMQTITWENGKLREKGKGKAASAKRRGFYVRRGWILCVFVILWLPMIAAAVFSSYHPCSFASAPRKYWRSLMWSCFSKVVAFAMFRWRGVSQSALPFGFLVIAVSLLLIRIPFYVSKELALVCCKCLWGRGFVNEADKRRSNAMYSE